MRQEIGKKVIVVEGVLDELSWSSDSEIADDLDYLDFEDDDESVQGAFTLQARGPNVPGVSLSAKYIFASIPLRPELEVLLPYQSFTFGVELAFVCHCTQLVGKRINNSSILKSCYYDRFDGRWSRNGKQIKFCCNCNSWN
ncbi:hypothetical protein Vadar_010277 [Vaccinium darrowii]|uniref:Uncharacterized protein n=1 Tax=Vaccinium darrowii TaxID=229202 RepID=A0ACB7YCY9_9ERIC|nr:hypothetical protein Vadar_010277 [Vaccinium darrowii]